MQSQDAYFSSMKKIFLHIWCHCLLSLELYSFLMASSCFKQIKLNRYSWRTSEWKECQVSLLLEQQDPLWHKTGPICGGGIQTREVYCAQSFPATITSRTKEGRQPAPGRGYCWMKGEPTLVPLLEFLLPWKELLLCSLKFYTFYFCHIHSLRPSFNFP